MKDLYILTILLFLSALAFGQEKSNRIYPGILIAPQVSEIFNSELNGEGKSSLGFLVEGRLFKRLSDQSEISLGLGIQSASIWQRDHSARWPVQVEDGEFKPSEDSYFDYHLDYLALGIPLGARLQLTKKPNHVYISGDLKFSFLFSTSHKFRFAEPGNPNISEADPDNFVEINKTQLSVGTGIGYDFALGSKHRLAIGPGFEYGFIDIVKSGYILNEAFPGGHPAFIGLTFLFYRARP